MKSSKMSKTKSLIKNFIQSKLFKNPKLIAAPILALAITVFVFTILQNKQTPSIKSQKITTTTISASTNPGLYYLSVKEAKDISKNAKSLIIKETIEGFTPYAYFKEEGKDIILTKTKSGVQKHVFSENSLKVHLYEKKDSEEEFTYKSSSNAIFEEKKNDIWEAVTAKEKKVKNTISQEEQIITLTQKQDEISIVWEFGIKNENQHIKNTFKLDGQKKSRMIWEISFPDEYKERFAKIEERQNQNKFILDDIVVNWGDFDEETKAVLDKENLKLKVIFYEEGKLAPLEIDPTLTMSTTGNYIQIYDGTRWWCFGPGQRSGTNMRFWQPAKFFHNSTGAPTNCTTGGDNLLPGDGTGTGSYDGFFDGENSIPDGSTNVLSLLETTPTRSAIQVARNTAVDSYAYYTTYPTGISFMEYRIGTATPATTNGFFSHYDPAGAPQIGDRDLGRGTIVISDTTNNNYAGMVIVPFSETTLTGNLNFFGSSSSDDYYGWYNNPIDTRTQIALALDYTNYRATTDTRDTLRDNFQTPDDLRDGLTNASLWDKSGEQSWLMHTSFEDADANLCDGGSFFTTGSCGTGATAVGNDPDSAYIGRYGARFSQGASNVVSYSRFDFTGSSTKGASVKFFMRINQENISDGQTFSIAEIVNDTITAGSGAFVRQISGQIYVCTGSYAGDSLSCGTTPLEIGKWYHIALVLDISSNATGSERTAIYLDGVLQGTYNNGYFTPVAVIRTGIVFADSGNNSVSIDNVSINYTDTDGHVIGFSPMDGAYTIEAQNWPSNISFDLDREGYQADNPIFLIRKWQTLKDPAVVKLEGKVLSNVADYNADVLPISEAWLFDGDGSGFIRIADGGDTADSDEFLADSTDNRNFGDATYNWGDNVSGTDYLYFGRADRFSGLNIALATLGQGSAQVTWQYCSANSDQATSCDTWSNLTVSESQPGVANFTTSGSFTYTPPHNWVRSTENSGRQGLYFIRAFVSSGSYSTYPVESVIKSDILAFQYFGTIRHNDQTFEFLVNSAVADWSFDEGSGNPQDNVHKISLTRSGALWRKNNKDSKRETYLEFDGIDDRLTASYSPMLDTGVSSFSATGWFRHPLNVTGTDTIISRASGVNGIGWKVYMNSSGQICFGIDDIAGSFPSDSACSTASYVDSSWHHFAAVKNETNGIYLYIDGRLVGQDTNLTAGGTLDASQSLYIGIDADSTSNPWQGDLDKIVIYSHALSLAEIYADIPDPTGALFGSNPTDPLLNGLVAWWRMDESSGNASDSSGNGYTLTNNGTTPYEGGRFGHAPVFNGTSRYFSTSTSISNMQTVSFWVYAVSATDEFIQLTSSARITASSGTISATGFTNPSIYVNGRQSDTIATNRWQHVIITTQSPITANAFEIGRANSNYTDNNTRIDDIRLYNRELSPIEAENLYGWGPGTIGYWKFDEGDGQLVYDSSGNGSTLRRGSTSSSDANDPSWSLGKYGFGFNFDGTNDYLENTSSYPVVNIQRGDLTISAWIIRNANDTYDSILRNRDGGHGTSCDPLANGYSLEIYNTNELALGLCDETNGWEIYTAPNAVPIRAWTHIAVTIDRINPSNSKIFINGSPVTVSFAGTMPTGNVGINNIQIGNTIGNLTWSHNGNIDNVKIYNYARTQKQIIEDMNAGHPMVGTPVTGPVAYYKFDEGGIVVRDASGNGNDLNISLDAMGIIYSSEGIRGMSLLNDGGPENLWASSPDNNNLDFGANEDFSISVWVRSSSTTNPTSNQFIFTKQQAINNPGYRLFFNTSGQIVCDIDDDTTGYPEDSATTTEDFYDTNWHHVVCIRDIASGRLYLYVDGRLAGEDSSLSAAGSLANNAWIYVGDDDGDTANSFIGQIDELKVYLATLMPSDILLEMNQGKTAVMGTLSTASDGQTASNAKSREYCVPGDTSGCNLPVGIWKLDENAGTLTTFDTSGNYRNGALTSITSSNWISGKFGSSLRLNGTSSYITITGESSSFSTNNYTLSAWIRRLSDSGSNEIIIDNRDGINDGHLMQINASDQIECYYNSTASVSTTTISLNTWYFVACTSDGSTQRLFINSILEDSDSISGSIFEMTDMRFGARSFTSAAFFFPGILDEIKIYNYARTPAQIVWDFNRGAPVAHYKMDECSGATIYDASVNANGEAGGKNGTWSGTSGSNTSTGACGTVNTSTARYNGRNGKFGSALDFDGTDDVVTVSNTSVIDLNEGLVNGLTISAWVYPRSDGEGDAGRIFDKGTNTYCRLANESGGNAEVRCRLGLATSAEFTAPQTIPLNQWSHVALSWTNDSDDEITIWINGTPYTSSALYAGDPTADTSNFFIGNNSAGSATFDGLIDDVRIYNYELTQVLIRNLINEASAIRFGPITGTP